MLLNYRFIDVINDFNFQQSKYISYDFKKAVKFNLNDNIYGAIFLYNNKLKMLLFAICVIINTKHYVNSYDSKLANGKGIDIPVFIMFL